jgi:hypothetical protein
VDGSILPFQVSSHLMSVLYGLVSFLPSLPSYWEVLHCFLSRSMWSLGTILIETIRRPKEQEISSKPIIRQMDPLHHHHLHHQVQALHRRLLLSLRV